MYGESIDAITFDFSFLERSLSRSLRFRRLIFHKGTELGYVLLLNTNRKSHMGSPTAPLHLTLGDKVKVAQTLKAYMS